MATKARSDVLTLALPAHLVSGLVDALDHLRSTATGTRRAELDELVGELAGGEVTAHRDVLRELLAVALDAAADRLSIESTQLLRGTGSTAEVRGGLAELGALLDLLEAVQARA